MFPLAIVTLSYLTVSVVGLGAARPHFSHVRDTISQLGESGARLGRLASYGVFLPVGVAMAVLASLAVSLDRDVALLAACLATGYLGAALFRCDPGAPSHGSFRQRVHNACGRVQYLGGAYALYRIAVQKGPLTAAPAVVVVLVSAVTLVPGQWRVRGLVQRIAELTLFVSLSLALWRSGASTEESCVMCPVTSHTSAMAVASSRRVAAGDRAVPVAFAAGPASARSCHGVIRHAFGRAN